MVAGNILQQVYNLADAFVVSSFIGADALGSIGATSSVQFLVLGFCIGCCAGFVIPVAQSTGARDKQRTEKYIVNGICAASVLSLVMTVLCLAFSEGILDLLKTPSGLRADAGKYMVTLFIGIPCTYAYNLSAGILRAGGDSKTPFRWLTVSSVLNIGLDILLVTVFHMGVQGTAAATVFSQAFSAALCFRSVYRNGMMPGRRGWRQHLDRAACGHLLAMGVPTGLQYSVTAVGTIIVQSANNALGSIYTTAFYTGSKIRQFFMCPFDAIATGTSVFAAQNYGAHNPSRVRQGIGKGVLLGVSYGAAAGIILYALAGPFAGIFLSTENQVILDAAVSYMRIIGLFLWLLGVLNVCRMCIQGLGYTKLALGSGVIELIARVILCYVWVPVYQFRAICMNEPAAWICAAAYVSLICLYIIRKKGMNTN